MTRNLILTGLLLVAVAISGGCSRQPTIPGAEFGDAVRNVMESQIHDYEAALHPTPDALEGIDPDFINAALNAYRSDIGQGEDVSQPVNINVGGR